MVLYFLPVTLPDVCSSVHASSNAEILRNGLKCRSWAIYSIISNFVGVTVYFPFNLAIEQDIPYHRWQSVRLAVFATFAFYGVMHLLHGSREVYPVHFLKTYLFVLSFVAVGVFLQEGVHALEYLLPALFFWIATSLHFATGTRLRRYFSKK